MIISRDLDSSAAREAIEALGNGPPELLPTIPLLLQAFHVARRLKHSVYDCLYLTCALGNKSRVVTADRRFFDSTRETTWAPSVVWVERRHP